MKIIARTTGNFGLMDFIGNRSNDLPSDRPAVIQKTTFYSQRIGLEQIEVLGEVPEDYTDEQFEKALSSGKKVEQILADLKKKPAKE